jgi:hypothetical protein
MAIELEQLSERIEECYEFTLSYAARGLAGDSGDEQTRQARDHLTRAVEAIRALDASCRGAIARERLEPRETYEAFLAVMKRDAEGAAAAIELVLVQAAIGSQLVDKGMDFRAPSGTPVRAGNGGIVVLARPLYYEGNCVVIDHGLGLFTVSMHLSRIDVKESQSVKLGEQIGLSGATGRVTGPHLHWSVRWQDASLDPAKLLKMDLSGVR